MAIRAIVGKPGGGKTLQCMRELVRILSQDSEIQVVTNLPLRLPELNELFAKRFPDAGGLIHRITVITEDEARNFWVHRGNYRTASGEWVFHSRGTVAPDGVGMVYPHAHPVLYVLDEFHLLFNAREWAKTGKTALWYASQHRHLGDGVIWVTQYSENVDKQFRVLTQDWTMCRNWSSESWLGWIRPPAKFQVMTSLDAPNKRGSASAATGGWRVVGLDKPLADCFDSMAGVGVVSGSVACDRVKPRGLPAWAAAAIGLVVIIGAAIGFPMLVGQGIASGAKVMIGQTQGAVGASAKKRVALAPTNAAPDAAVLPPVPPGASVTLTSAPPVAARLVATMPTRRGLRIASSDGRSWLLGVSRDVTSWDQQRGVLTLGSGEVLTW